MALRIAGKKDEGNGKKWMAIFIAVIMLASVAGFVLTLSPSAQANNFRYAGLAFTQAPDGLYSTSINSKDVSFIYRPEDVSDIEIPTEIVGKLTSARALYITYHWNSTVAQEMAVAQFDLSSLLDAKDVFAQPAFTTENPMNSPVKACSDATPFVPVFLLQEGDSTAISLDSENPDCIVLNATGSTSLLRAADGLKYAIISGEGNG